MKASALITSRRLRTSAAFTLVEVCVAIGIMAFTLIPLIGLTMPNSSQIVYTAVVTITAYNGTSTPQALPGGDARQPTLLSLKVQVRKTPGGLYALTNPVVATYVGKVSCNDLDYSGNSAL